MVGKYEIPPLSVILADFIEALSYWEYPDCAAPFWRFYWNAQGHGRVEIEGTVHELTGSTTLLIPPETHFSTTLVTPADHLYLHFLVGSPYAEAPPCVISEQISIAEQTRLLEFAGSLVSAKSKTIRSIEGGRSEERRDRGIVLRAASICLAALAGFPQNMLSDWDSDAVISKINRLVESRWSAPPSLDEIADCTGLSAPTLERHVRKKKGLSVHSYTLQLRVVEACIRLRHSSASVEEVAEQLGFADRSHFSRVFTRIRGESPSAYRLSTS